TFARNLLHICAERSLLRRNRAKNAPHEAGRLLPDHSCFKLKPSSSRSEGTGSSWCRIPGTGPLPADAPVRSSLLQHPSWGAWSYPSRSRLYILRSFVPPIRIHINTAYTKPHTHASAP